MRIKQTVMKQILLGCTILLLSMQVDAQFENLLKRTGDKLKQKVDQKVDQKIDNAVNKTVDGVDDAATGKKKKNENTEQNKDDKKKENATGFKAYSKFDFVPGEKVLVEEGFAQDAIGDFPDKWNTNASGEIVHMEGQTGKWLLLGKDGVFMPEFITQLPENFTFEYDVMCNEGYSFYSSALSVAFASLTNPGKDFMNWKVYSGNKDGVQFSLHPTGAGSSAGQTSFHVYDKGEETMKNEASQVQFMAKKQNFVKVHIWRQKQRLRVYMNEEKVWDIPRAFVQGKKYNAVVFTTGSVHQADDKYTISNIRLAVGAPDTRNKLITEGKFVTHGILFDPNSDKIKPESYGTLKDIATVLTENETVNVTIVGHTDSDGDEKANLDLSKRRAESVKQILIKEFSIDAARMKTDGKGENQPSDVNTTSAGKANNRRVEFIKY
jgi:OmpA-OmpF porin, OOP family